MAASMTLDDLFKRNEDYVRSGHVAPPMLKDIAGRTGALSMVIVSCVDARVQPEKFLNLKPGEAFVLKTVAGHPQHSLQDIMVLDALSPLQKLIIMHHTDCGAASVTNESIRNRLILRLPEKKTEIDAMEFGAISDFKASLKTDVAWLKANPYIRKELAENIVGMLYNLQTGVVEQVRGGMMSSSEDSKSEL